MWLACKSLKQYDCSEYDSHGVLLKRRHLVDIINSTVISLCHRSSQLQTYVTCLLGMLASIALFHVWPLNVYVAQWLEAWKGKSEARARILAKGVAQGYQKYFHFYLNIFSLLPRLALANIDLGLALRLIMLNEACFRHSGCKRKSCNFREIRF